MKILIILIILNFIIQALTELANVNLENPNSRLPSSETTSRNNNKVAKNNEIKNENCIESLTSSYRKEELISDQTYCKGELIFEETFQSNYLDSTNWSKEIRIPSDADDGDFISYQDLPENCYIKYGHLHIVPTLLENTDGFNANSIRSGTLNLSESCTSSYYDECSRTAQYFRILPPVVSAKIVRRGKFEFRYGRIEIKAKLPKGDWIFPQLLLEPIMTKYRIRGYESGQIRIAFIRGNDILDNKNGQQIDGFRLYGGVVVTVGEELRDKFLVSILQRKHLSDEFHIYSMIWTNESMTFELDGAVFCKINGGFSDDRNLMKLKQSNNWRKYGEFMAPFDEKFFISLGVSVGGISDFPDDSKTGRRGIHKPWVNRDPKAELRFWNNRSDWYSSWNWENAGLKVDYIRVWAL